MTDIEHGTSYAAFQRCRKANPDGACTPCKRANAAWVRQYRMENPQAYAREKRLSNAQGKAVWRLAKMHPGMFQALVAEELEKLDQRHGGAT